MSEECRGRWARSVCGVGPEPCTVRETVLTNWDFGVVDLEVEVCL